MVVALVGCRTGAPAKPELTGARCLDLPGTARASLRLAPDGRSLYWHEQVPFYGYSNSWPKARVSRWDLGEAPPRVVTDLAGAPFRVLPDGRVVAAGDSGVVLWTDGVGELVSEHDEIDHLEVVGGDIIYLSDGALWRQPLHRATAARIAAADVLVGTSGERVVFWRGEALIARDAAGTETALPEPAGELIKVLDDAMVVRQDGGLALQPLTGGAAKVVLAGEWRTYLGPDGVRAYRSVKDRIEVAVITGTGVEQLPGVVGGVAVVGAVRLPDRRVAYLVGFDTDGDGDVTSGDEHDVCVGTADQPLVVTPRAVPRRWVRAVPALDRLAGELGAKGYHFSSSGELPKLTFHGAPKDSDRAARWALVRRAAAASSEALGDPSLDVIIEFADGGRALAEWAAASGKRVAWAGVGGALVADPADYDVEVATETLARDESGNITCAGSVTNKTDRALAGLVVDCVGGESDTPIPVFPTTVPPGHVARFSGTTPGDADGGLVASVHRPESAQNFLTYDRGRAERFERIAAAAAEVVDRSRLTVWDWSGGVHVGVELWGPDDFTDYSDSARTMAAEIAYDVLAKVPRAAWLGEADAPLALTIHAGSAVWTYDGKQLTEGEPE